jgi:hypothetical protein
MRKDKYAYRWISIIQKYEVYDTITGTPVGRKYEAHEVENARKKVDELNAKARKW